MRIKDELKQEAIIRATIKLVNKIGFASSSVAKIAKEANVSPATIYIYYKNKEDLLVSTYLNIKQQMGIAMLKDFNEDKPIRDIFRIFWINSFDYISKKPEFFYYAEQFVNSPYSELVNKSAAEKNFEPILKTIKKGIDQQIIKDVSIDILSAFIFHPIIVLANPRKNRDTKLDKKTIETAFQLAWDAIKL